MLSAAADTEQETTAPAGSREEARRRRRSRSVTEGGGFTLRPSGLRSSYRSYIRTSLPQHTHTHTHCVKILKICIFSIKYSDVKCHI